MCGERDAGAFAAQRSRVKLSAGEDSIRPATPARVGAQWSCGRARRRSSAPCPPWPPCSPVQAPSNNDLASESNDPVMGVAPSLGSSMAKDGRLRRHCQELPASRLHVGEGGAARKQTERAKLKDIRDQRRPRAQDIDHHIGARSREAIAAGFDRPVEGQVRARAGDGDLATRVTPQAVLASAISIAELSRRPSRPPDYAAENRALVALAQTLATSPDGILQMLADTALTLCRAHSAGLSLLRRGTKSGISTGAPSPANGCRIWAGELRATLAHAAPSWTATTALLFSHPERDFPYFGEVMPLLEEGLLIPFYVDGEAVGTIWVVAHDESRRFDAEDLRVTDQPGHFRGGGLSDIAVPRCDDQGQPGTAGIRLSNAAARLDRRVLRRCDREQGPRWHHHARGTAGAERLFGYAAEEAVGKLDYDPDTAGPSRRGTRRFLDASCAASKSTTIDTVRRRKDGSLVEISLSVSPSRMPRAGSSAPRKSRGTSPNANEPRNSSACSSGR